MSEAKEKKIPSLIFVIVVLFIVFLSISIQLVLSEKRVNQWVSKIVNKQNAKYSEGKLKIKIEYKTASPALNASLVSPLALRVKGLKLDIESECYRLTGVFGTVFLPLNLKKIINKNIDIGHTRFSDGKFKIYPTCESRGPVQAVSLPSPKVKKKNLEAELIKKVQAVDFQKILNARGENFNISGILAYNIKVEYEESFLDVERLKLRFSKESAIADWTSSVKIKDFSAELNGEAFSSINKMQADISLKKKESNISLKAILVKEEGENKLSTLFQVSNTPLSFVNRIKDIGIKGLDTRRTWLSFDFNTEINKTKILGKINNAKLYGDFGSLGLSSADLTWNNNKWSLIKSSEISIDAVKIENLFDSSDLEKVKSVFGSLGILNANLNIESFKNINGPFEISDLAIFFRSMGKKLIQNVDSIKGKIEYLDKEKRIIRMHFDEYEISGGELVGDLIFTYDVKSKFLSSKIDINKFISSNEVIKNLFELVEPIEIFDMVGSGEYQPKIKENLNFKFTIKKLIRKNIQVIEPQFDCVLKENLNCRLSFNEMTFSKALKESLNLKETFSIKNTKNAKLIFEKGVLEINLPGSIKVNWSSAKGSSVQIDNKETVFIRNL